MSADQNVPTNITSLATGKENTCPNCYRQENVTPLTFENQIYYYCSSCNYYLGYYTITWNGNQTDPTGPTPGTIVAG